MLPIEGSDDTTYMFMGDRWSFPKQASAATYIWQPLAIAGFNVSIPQFQQAWEINESTGVASPANIRGRTIENTDQRSVSYTGKWQHDSDTVSLSSSDELDAACSIRFKGTQVSVYGMARPDGGYARVTLRDSKGKAILSSIVDMYCKYPVAALNFQSPVLSRDNYTVTVSVMRERGNWSDKRKNNYGSTGYVVSIDKIVILE